MSTTHLASNKQQLNTILNDYGVVDALVFGSFARGDAGPKSDLDLLVTYKPGTTLFDMLSLQDELERVLGRKVDLVSHKYLSKRLAKRIDKDLRPLSSVL
jgi:predicted nucleotidyltransferase